MDQNPTRSDPPRSGATALDARPDELPTSTGPRRVGTSWRSDASWYRVVAVLTIAPIVIAAIRDGLGGWVPTFDSANFTMWSRFSLGTHPYLVGIYTDASRWAGTATFFPGPWWLWWMAIPIRLLGPTWGPLLSVATLQSGWILLAGWSVKQRLGPRTAMAALVFLASLTWTLGTSAYHSPVGQVMIVPTFAAFLFIAWAVAAGDGRVLWAFALITNFIMLDEVVLVRVVPVVACAALGIWLVTLARSRRSDRASWPELRRRSVRSVIRAALITVAMWTPTMVQQVTHHPGNLTNLWRAAQANPTTTVIWGRAYEVLLSLFVEPPSWLHGSRTTNNLIYSPPPSSVTLVLASIVLAGLTMVLAILALRRRDHPGLAALALAVVLFAAAWYNLANPPDPTGMPTYVGYYLSTWAVAMFVTFALAFNLVRSRPSSGRYVRSPVFAVLALVLAAANMPHANHPDGTYESDDPMIENAAAFNAAILTAVRHRGNIEFARSDIYSTPYVLSAAVALQHAGIPFCISGVAELTPLPIPPCADYPSDVIVTINRAAADSETGPDDTVVARSPGLSARDRRELAGLTARVIAAVDSQPHLEVTDEFRSRLMVALPPGPLRDATLSPDVFASPNGLITTRKDRAELAGLIDAVSRTIGRDGVAMIRLPGISDGELVRWAELEVADVYRSFTVTIAPPS